MTFARKFTAVRIAAAAALASAITAELWATVPTILETHDASLTTYLPQEISTGQGVRPLAEQRGVNLDGSLRLESGPPMDLAGNPFGESWNGNALLSGIRLDAGTYSITDVDLALSAPGFSWVIGRSYNPRQKEADNDYFDSNGYQGVNWFQLSQPEIVLYDAVDGASAANYKVYLVYGADRYIEFKRKNSTSTQYKAVNGAGGVMEFIADYNGANSPDVFVYTDQRGWQTFFFGFDAHTYLGAQGQFWKAVAPGPPGPGGNDYVAYVGHETNAGDADTGYFGGSRGMFGVTDTAGRSYAFNYVLYQGTWRLKKVEVSAELDGPTVARVEYAYYVDNDLHGDDGDLKLVTISTPLTDTGLDIENMWLVRKKLYRYYDTDPGDSGPIKYIYDFEGYRRYDWLNGSPSSTLDDTPLGATEDQLKPYASAYFEYDSDRRITKAWFNGSCGCGGGAADGTHEFTYGNNGSYTNDSGYDTEWATRTIVERPAAGTVESWLTQYFDEVGQPLHRVETDGDPADTDPAPPQFWATQIDRNASGQITAVHSPANITGYTHSSASFTPDSGNGLITVFDRVGAAVHAGYVESIRHRKGTGGSANYDTTLYYTTPFLDLGDFSVFRAFIDSSWVYTEETTDKAGDGSDPAGAYETTYEYDFYGEFDEGATPLAVQELTTTYPAVSTANKGSGSATLARHYFDEAGRLIFEKTTDGIINYWQYKSSDGQLEKIIQDADTGEDDFTECDVDVPSNFTSSGTEMHRVTCYSYKGGDSMSAGFIENCPSCVLEAEGNTSTEGDGPTATSYTARLADGRFVTLGFADYEDMIGSNDVYYGPVTYTVHNHAGGIDREALVALASSTADPDNFIFESDDDPITALGIGTITQMMTYLYSKTGGRLEESRQYFSIPEFDEGTSASNFDPTFYDYDDLGRTTGIEDPTGTIRTIVYDSLGRVTERWIGTDDDPSTGNMVRTVSLEYDGGADSDNGYLTREILYLDGETTPATRETTSINDLRGRPIVTIGPTPPYAVNKFDNLGRLTATGLFSSSSGLSEATDPATTGTMANRLALSRTFYDELGRVFKSQTHKIQASDGADLDNLESVTWRDAAGRVIKVDGSQLTKTLYDRLGRQTRHFILACDNDTVYGDADDVTGDHVVQESQSVYQSKSSDDVWLSATIDRFHDDGSGGHTGVLDDNADGGTPDPLVYTAADLHGRIQITAYWYDDLGRVTDSASYGTNGDADFTRDAEQPQYTDQDVIDGDTLLTHWTYDADGTVLEVTDPRELVTHFQYDAAGRRIKVVNNCTGGQPGGCGDPSGDANQTIAYTYSKGLLTAMTADLPSGQNDQVTTYTYGVSAEDSDGPSAIDSNDLLRTIVYPPQTASQAEADRRVLLAYNAQGQEIWTKDQAGNVIETSFDASGRPAHRRWTGQASGFDTAVARISTVYDALGREDTITQYGDPDVGQGTALDQVDYGYDHWGHVLSLKQDRDSVVGGTGVASYDLVFSHAKATGGRNTLRRVETTLPGGEKITYAYESTSGNLDADLSRVTKVKLGAVYVDRYWYNGLDQLVGTRYPEPADDVQWVLYGSTTGSYPGLDPFNRVASCTWTKQLATPLAFHDVSVSYDPGSNVEATVDHVFADSGNTFFDVTYTLDDLNRLTKSQWEGSATSSQKRETLWTLTQTGNWDRVQRDLDDDDDFTEAGEMDDDRDHNDVNEITDREEASLALVHDKLGNLIDDDLHYEYTYDVFGRLREVRDTDDQSLVAEYRYNGLGQRIGWHYDVNADTYVDGDDPWFFFAYDDRWRNVTVYQEDDGDADSIDELAEQFTPHAAGLDGYGDSSALDGVIRRDRDTNLDGTREERRYYCQDWHGDVVVILTDDAKIAERVKYSDYGIPFGMPLGDLDADGTVGTGDGDAITAWWGTPGDVRGDLDLDGDVDWPDLSTLLGNGGATLGWGALSDIGNRRGYAGYEFDPALEASYSFYHVRRRVLNADLGRWITRDPLGYVDGANLYQYVRSNPLGAVDPSGTGPGDPGGPTPGPGLRPRKEPRDLCGPGNPQCMLSPCDGFAKGSAEWNKCKCDEWQEREKKDIGWRKQLRSLPKCPCSLQKSGSEFQNPAPDRWNDPSDPNKRGMYHPGAHRCMRSKPKSDGGPGQQCCYNKSGKLITRCEGAGTPDRVTPQRRGDVLPHIQHDVTPFEQCKAGDQLDKYWEVRPPDKGVGCEELPLPGEGGGEYGKCPKEDFEPIH